MDESDAEGDLAEAVPGRASLGSSRGAPERPLLEAFIVLAALYGGAYLPADPSALGGMLARPSFYFVGMVATLPGALLVLYLMAVTDGLAAFRIRPPTASSLLRAGFLAAFCLAVVFALGRLLDLLGIANPIWDVRGGAPIALVPLILASSIATGYCEELCFRAYLPRRLRQAGLAPAGAIAVSTALFAGAHGVQGIAGFATAAILGLAFAIRFHRSGDIHEVAIGHAAYNAVVFLVELYS